MAALEVRGRQESQLGTGSQTRVRALCPVWGEWAHTGFCTGFSLCSVSTDSVVVGRDLIASFRQSRSWGGIVAKLVDNLCSGSVSHSRGGISVRSKE